MLINSANSPEQNIVVPLKNNTFCLMNCFDYLRIILFTVATAMLQKLYLILEKIHWHNSVLFLSETTIYKTAKNLANKAKILRISTNKLYKT